MAFLFQTLKDSWNKIQETKKKAKKLGIDSHVDYLMAYLIPKFFFKRVTVVNAIAVIAFQTFAFPLEIITGNGVGWYTPSILIKQISMIMALIVLLSFIVYVAISIVLYFTLNPPKDVPVDPNTKKAWDLVKEDLPFLT